MERLTIECRAQLEALGLWPLIDGALARSRASRARARRRLAAVGAALRVARQLDLPFDAPIAPTTKPRSAPTPLLTSVPRPKDAEDIPIGSIVRTPTGALAEVLAYRGGRRMGGGAKDNHERLFCRYLSAKNRRFSTLLIKPELVEIVKEEENHGT